MRFFIFLSLAACASAQPTWREGSAPSTTTPAASLPPVATALTSDPAPMPESGGGHEGHHGHHGHGHQGHDGHTASAAPPSSETNAEVETEASDDSSPTEEHHAH